MENELYRIILITTMASFMIGFVYVVLIRPRLRQRRTIAETREWLFKQMGLTDTSPFRSDDSKDLPDSTEVITDIREYWGYPPKQELIFEEIDSKTEVRGDWDYALHIHEASEQYLGSKIYYDLQNRFAAIPGVDECLQEDRELFLVKTRTLDAEKLRNAFWQEFLKAAKEVFET